MCLSLSPQLPMRQPSIVLTKASVEQEEDWGGSIGSRLPSHLSLGSTDFIPTPAPSTPLPLFTSNDFPQNRSVTPILFPEHKLEVPSNTVIKRGRSKGGLNRSGLFKSALNLRKSQRGSTCALLSSSSSLCSLKKKVGGSKQMKGATGVSGMNKPTVCVTPAEPDTREKKMMSGVIKEWTKQACLETRV